MKEFQNFNSLNNKNLLVVLPINRIEDFFLNECLYSLAQQEQKIDLLVLASNLDDDSMNILKQIVEAPKITISKKNDKGEVEKETLFSTHDINFIIESSSADNFAKVFNEGINYAHKNNYTWVSFVEYDDIVDVKWYSTALKFAEAKTEIDGFLPLTKEVSNGAFLGYFNEACWVDGYAEVPGIFDLQLMLKFNCMNITGTMFKVQALIDKSELKDGIYKPMKESIKIGYTYEFYLRMIYNFLQFYTIIRSGYEHRIDRPTTSVNYFSSKLPRQITSFSGENGGISQEEQSFWLNVAKKEYFYDNDRNIQFVPKEEKKEQLAN